MIDYLAIAHDPQGDGDEIRHKCKKLITQEQVDDESTLPGASMYHESPIEVPEKMQHAVVENNTIYI